MGLDGRLVGLVGGLTRRGAARIRALGLTYTICRPFYCALDPRQAAAQRLPAPTPAPPPTGEVPRLAVSPRLSTRPDAGVKGASCHTTGPAADRSVATRPDAGDTGASCYTTGPDPPINGPTTSPSSPARSGGGTAGGGTSTDGLVVNGLEVLGGGGPGEEACVGRARWVQVYDAAGVAHRLGRAPRPRHTHASHALPPPARPTTPTSRPPTPPAPLHTPCCPTPHTACSPSANTPCSRSPRVSCTPTGLHPLPSTACSPRAQRASSGRRRVARTPIGPHGTADATGQHAGQAGPGGGQDSGHGTGQGTGQDAGQAHASGPGGGQGSGQDTARGPYTEPQGAWPAGVREPVARTWGHQHVSGTAAKGAGPPALWPRQHPQAKVAGQEAVSWPLETADQVGWKQRAGSGDQEGWVPRRGPGHQEGSGDQEGFVPQEMLTRLLAFRGQQGPRKAPPKVTPRRRPFVADDKEAAVALPISLRAWLSPCT